MLSKHWKYRTAILTPLVVLQAIFLPVVAQTPSQRSAISQSSTNYAEHRRDNLRFHRDHDKNVDIRVLPNTNTGHVKQETENHVKKKPPLICRSRAIRTWLRWKCPKA